MKYWLDTEFVDDGETIGLISIGVVSEDGREFYRQSTDLHFNAASEWVKQNVYPNLDHFPTCPDRIDCMINWEKCPWRSREQIATDLLKFIEPTVYGSPEFWGFVSAYDWVVTCQLFGPLITRPKGWPMICRDLRQWADQFDRRVSIPKPEGSHNALVDARWNRQMWDAYKELEAARHHTT